MKKPCRPGLARSAALRLGLIAAALNLGACGTLLSSHQPVPQIYYLRLPSPGSPTMAQAASAAPSRAKAPPGSAAASPPGRASSIRIARPDAGPGLDSASIVLLEKDRRMSFYAASRWAAALPDVVESLASQSLRNSGSWSSVLESQTSFPADYLLQIRIRAFEARYSSDSRGRSAMPPEIHVVLDCTLGRRSGREAIGQFTVEGAARASANRMDEIVAAFGSATEAAMSDLAGRTAEAVYGAAQKVDRPVPSMKR